MNFKNRLATITPRDVSGSRSSDRFVYQQTWALCRLLELHGLPDDYVMTFDYHEDVSILDAEHEPTKISAFQIKTASDNWTIPKLIKRLSGRGKAKVLLPSILGKLYDLKLKYPDEVSVLAFVSNTSVTVHVKPDGKKSLQEEETSFNNLSPADQKLVADALKAEFTLSDGPQLDGILRFTKATLPLKDHATHAKGNLVDFLEIQFPTKQFPITPLFSALLSEVAARNNNQDKINSYDDFLRHKSISRRRFAEILSQAGVSAKRVDWIEVAQRLGSEEVPFSESQAIRREWDGVVIDRLSRRDIPYQKLWTAIRTACGESIEELMLMSMLKSIYSRVATKLRREWGFTEPYVKTCIIFQIYELESPQDSRTAAEEEGQQ